MQPKRVGLLCTGNEIIEGRVLNSNAHVFANRLFEEGMIPGTQVTVSDIEEELERGFRWLLDTHDAIITCGGLGPTSDDKTRIAIAKVARKNLILNEENWQAIQSRLKQFDIPIHPSNQQQAFFPEGAILLENGLGTAAGFMFFIEEKPVFVLPGPPHECLPIFEKRVLPVLTECHFKTTLGAYFTRLIGVSEADIAARIDTALNRYEVETAFCWQYPFCDILVKIKNETDETAITHILDTLLLPYCVGKTKKAASHLARETLAEKKISLTVEDKCSGGLLAAYLYSPDTHLLLKPAGGEVKLSLIGLSEWQAGAPFKGSTHFQITITGKGTVFQETKTISYSAYRVRDYAVEYACFRLLHFLRKC